MKINFNSYLKLYFSLVIQPISSETRTRHLCSTPKLFKVCPIRWQAIHDPMDFKWTNV